MPLLGVAARRRLLYAIAGAYYLCGAKKASAWAT